MDCVTTHTSFTQTLFSVDVYCPELHCLTLSVEKDVAVEFFFKHSLPIICKISSTKHP